MSKISSVRPIRSHRLICTVLLMVVGLFVSAPLRAQAPTATTWYERKTEWKGFDQFHFKVLDRAAYIVVPQVAAAGNPWIWRARFPGYHAEMDVALVKNGFHIAYVDVGGLFGGPDAMKAGDALYEFVTKQRGLASKPALEGVSRGGLLIYNWAARNPDKVACIYCDTPVCDFKSWPGGKGTGVGAKREWEQCKNAYGLSEQDALAYANNPIDTAKVIGEARIPVLHIVAENDRIVPPQENTYLLKERMLASGNLMQVISVAEGTEKSSGHHFTHPNPQRVVDFIAEHAATKKATAITTAEADAVNGDRIRLLKDAQRIAFLGDSITFGGSYIAFFEAWMSSQDLPQHPVVINVGLSSETVSGLSEQGHAGGKFPRPDLAERLERVLRVAKPDLVFACYGINCGIYQPFDEARFQAYKDGIHNLRKHVEKSGATLIHVTPPTYDDHRRPKKFAYNAVMDRYAEWLVSQEDQGWLVVDLHAGMSKALQAQRKLDADFTFQPDAVHPNADGHWCMARELIGWFGDDQAAAAETFDEMLKLKTVAKEDYALMHQRLNLRRNAYVSAAGHKRPGVGAGLPLDEAEAKANSLTVRLKQNQTTP